MKTVVFHLSASKKHLERFCQQQAKGHPTYLQQAYHLFVNRVAQLSHSLKAYWTLYEGLLLYSSHILIPTSLQKQILQKIHYSHQGIQWCHLRISTPVWWPGISKAIETFIKSCPQCVKSNVPLKEPLLTSPLPWQKVAADLFKLNKAQYVIVVDYFSR